MALRMLKSSKYFLWTLSPQWSAVRSLATYSKPIAEKSQSFGLLHQGFKGVTKSSGLGCRSHLNYDTKRFCKTEVMVSYSVYGMKDALKEGNVEQAYLHLKQIEPHLDSLSEDKILIIGSYMTWIYALTKDFDQMETFTNMVNDLDLNYERLKRTLGVAIYYIEAGQLDDAYQLILRFQQEIFQNLSLAEKLQELENAHKVSAGLSRCVGEHFDCEEALDFLQRLLQFRMLSEESFETLYLKKLITGALNRGDAENIFRVQTKVYTDYEVVSNRIKTLQFFIDNDQEDYLSKFLSFYQEYDQESNLLNFQLIYAFVSRNNIEMANRVFHTLEKKPRENGVRVCRTTFNELFYFIQGEHDISGIDKFSEVLTQQKKGNVWPKYANEGLKACLLGYLRNPHKARYILKDICDYTNSLGNQETNISRSFQECQKIMDMDENNAEE